MGIAKSVAAVTPRIEDQPAWKAPELKLDDKRILVLDGDNTPGTRPS